MKMSQIESRVDRRKQKKSKKKRNWWILTPLIIFVVLILSVVGYATHIYLGVRGNINQQMYEPVTSIDSNITQKKLKDKENINVLLLGVDSDSSTKGRTDAMIVLTLKPGDSEMQMISIPRDSRTEIIGRGIDDKINHAHAFGGPDMAIETVENFLDIDLDYFVRINMDGLVELVNELGKITINNELEFSANGHHFPLGEIELDGDKTLSYVRMRKQDPAGDFGRTDRQRKVIEGIIKEGATIANVPRIVELSNILGQNLGTNMEFNDIVKLFQDYRHTMRNMESYRIEGTGATIGGIYYYIVPVEEVTKVKEMIDA